MNYRSAKDGIINRLVINDHELRNLHYLGVALAKGDGQLYAAFHHNTFSSKTNQRVGLFLRRALPHPTTILVVRERTLVESPPSTKTCRTTITTTNLALVDAEVFYLVDTF